MIMFDGGPVCQLGFKFIRDKLGYFSLDLITNDHQRANDKAESAVKIMKSLLIRRTRMVVIHTKQC